MSLYDEIYQQPLVLKEMYEANREKIQAMVAEIGPIKDVFIAARGTSDNAARYAQYVWGAFNRIPVTLATPSLFSLYHQPPRLTGKLILGISQSGESPDILAVIEEGLKQGCQTMAITNKVNSPLAKLADYVIDIRAGTEKAVAASKSYTAQLQSIAMISAAWKEDPESWKEIQSLPNWASQILENREVVEKAVPRYRYMDQCVVLGRGFNYATAFEWSLKLKELTYVMAEPYSSADFQHGPVAMVSAGFPVFAIAPQGSVYKDMYTLLSELKKEHSVDLFLISNQEEALALADTPLPLPTGIPEWLTPIVGILPAQLFCHQLAKEKGFDPDKPRGLTKVTRTT
jgi:glucosamine--fructose-6-phosphate aminotransferase (isomerizing)